MNDLRRNIFVIFIAAIASTGGLLFGFDTGVISGAIPFLEQDFSLTEGQIENITAFGLIGAVGGAIFGGRISDLVGRKKVIIVSAIVFATGAFWSGAAPNFIQLLLARLYLGVAIGVSSFAVPLYIAEISPTRIRGTLVSLFQFMITIGILVSYISDSAIADNSNISSWRPMFYIGVIPAIILFIGAIFLPETPRWLINKGRTIEGRSILAKIEDQANLNSVFHNLLNETDSNNNNQNWGILFKKWLRSPLIIAIGIMFFQQFVGINTVIYYSPKIFLKAGFLGNEAAIFASISVGVINVLLTIVSILIIDRIGRRKLFFIGMTGIITSLILMGVAFLSSEVFNQNTKWLLVVSMLSYVGFFALSLGPLGWLIISEVFPLKIRGLGASIGSLSNWGFNTLVAWSFFKLIRTFGDAEVFWLFALIGIIGTIWGYFYIPETKGISLEAIEDHWKNNKTVRKLGQAD
nr:sugar porter family MFS transporter [uncultured Draconibacterium sp.]